jgi:hypothetical protein
MVGSFIGKRRAYHREHAALALKIASRPAPERKALAWIHPTVVSVTQMAERRARARAVEKPLRL